jgi:hypothetical protein
MAESGLAAGLAAEYEAIYAFGAAGPQLSGALLDAVKAAEKRHRARRDTIIAYLGETGVDVPAAEPAYRLPELTDAAAATALVSDVEDKACQAWRSVLPNVTSDDREAAAAALADSAVAAARWRRAIDESPSVTPFPGRS